MTRGLSTAQKNLLDDDVNVIETLIQMDYDGSSNFFTMGSSETTATTTSSGGSQTFTPLDDNPILEISPIVEKPVYVENRVGIKIGGDMTVAIGNISTLPLLYQNGTLIIYIHKLFRNITTNAVESADPILVFAGELAKKQLTRKVKMSINYINFCFGIKYDSEHIPNKIIV